MGINLAEDVSKKGNYSWEYTSKQPLKVDSFACPKGSKATVSRSIFTVTAPKGETCVDSSGHTETLLKLLPNGKATTIPDGSY